MTTPGGATGRDDRPEEAAPFGTRLRALRRAAHLTQRELAERSGLSEHTIGQLERGARRTPQHAPARMLADALGLAGPDREAFFDLIRRERAPRRRTAALATPLPPEGQALVGREQALGDLLGALGSPGGGIVTLAGPGGVGKTRLAREAVARAVADDLIDLAAWVDLAPLEDPADVLPAVARAVGAPLPPGADPAAGIADALRGRRALLALDNLEHLPAAWPEVARLAAAAPGALLLCTSRTPLRLAGENLRDVPPLPLPSPGAPAEALRDEPTVALFAAAAGQPVAAGDTEDVADICRRLDGLPLAIELAGRQSRQLPPRAMLALLDRAGPALLAAASPGAPERHATMAAAIAWSASRLSPEGRRLLALVGVFRGGATAEAIVAVADALGDPDLPAAIPELVESGLARASAGGRISLLEPVRLVARDLLRQDGREREARLAHAGWFLEWAARQGEAIAGRDPAPAFDAVEADLANVREAIAAAAGLGRAAAARRTSVALRRFFEGRGYLAEGARSLDAALAPDAGDGHGHGHVDGATAMPPELMDALFWRAYIAAMLVDHATAARILDRLEPAAEASGSPEHRALAGIGRWMVLIAHADTVGLAPPHLERAWSLVHDRPGSYARWALLQLRGVDLQERGDAAAAAPLLAEALAEARARGCAVDVPVPLTRLGLALLDLGRGEEARERFAEAIAAAERFGMPNLALIPLLGLARADAAAGDAPGLERAARRLGAATALMGRLGYLEAGEPAFGPYWQQVVADVRARAGAVLGEARHRALESEGAGGGA